jgi:hypothetical protein
LLGAEIDTPEMWGGGEKLDADSRAFITRVSQVHDAAFLLLLCFWIDQDEHFAAIDLVTEIQKAAMGADDQSLADFTKLAAFVITTQGLQPHFVKNALAAALRGLSEFYHGVHDGFSYENRSIALSDRCSQVTRPRHRDLCPAAQLV